LTRRLAVARRPLAALAAALAFAPAGATTVRTGKPAASQPAATAFATREQLRACLAAEAGLQERLRAIEAANAAHQKLFDQVEAENARLQALQARLDHDSDASVNAFNAQVQAHNQHVQALNQDAADARPAADAYNADLDAYNRQCGALRYRVEDMQAVEQERRRAAASAPL
jgi:predicted  nucleic acid-binding Zn-ribbon protein